MPIFISARRDDLKIKTHLFLLTLCAVLGAAGGIAFAVYTDQLYTSLMRRAADCSVSIVGSIAAILPFLVSFYLLIYSKPWLVYPICAAAAFMLTSAQWAIRTIYGSAGWLICNLLQFSEISCTLALFYIAIGRITGKYNRMTALVPAVICTGIGIVDLILVSPFLASLLQTFETMGRYAIHVGLDRCI